MRRAWLAIRWNPAFSKLLLELDHALLELGEPFSQLWKVTKDRRRFQPLAVTDGRVARHELARVDRIGNAALRGRDHPFSDTNVTRHPHLTRQNDIVFNHRAAGNADLGSQQHTFA